MYGLLTMVHPLCCFSRFYASFAPTNKRQWTVLSAPSIPLPKGVPSRPRLHMIWSGFTGHVTQILVDGFSLPIPFRLGTGGGTGDRGFITLQKNDGSCLDEGGKRHHRGMVGSVIVALNHVPSLRCRFPCQSSCRNLSLAVASLMQNQVYDGLDRWMNRRNTPSKGKTCAHVYRRSRSRYRYAWW